MQIIDLSRIGQSVHQNYNTVVEDSTARHRTEEHGPTDCSATSKPVVERHYSHLFVRVATTCFDHAFVSRAKNKRTAVLHSTVPSLYTRRHVLQPESTFAPVCVQYLLAPCAPDHVAASRSGREYGVVSDSAVTVYCSRRLISVYLISSYLLVRCTRWLRFVRTEGVMNAGCSRLFPTPRPNHGIIARQKKNNVP